MPAASMNMASNNHNNNKNNKNNNNKNNNNDNDNNNNSNNKNKNNDNNKMPKNAKKSNPCWSGEMDCKGRKIHFCTHHNPHGNTTWHKVCFTVFAAAMAVATEKTVQHQHLK